jgi:3-oxo-5alpha-steroid 4-dehydrogenase
MHSFREVFSIMDDVSLTQRLVSRRRFLGTSGAGLAAGLGGAIGLRDSAHAAQTELPATWDIEADVVVIGAGGAGTCAAIEAARAGASVVVFEKASTPGGNTAHSGGVIYLGGGTPLQKANGFEDTPENMYAYLELQMGPTSDHDRLHYYCDNSVDHYNWLIEAGVTFGEKYWEGKVVQPSAEDGGLYFSDNQTNAPFSELIDPMPRGHMMKGAGAAVYQALHTTAAALPIQWHFNTRGERLIVSDGRVVGIVVQTGIADPSDPTTDGTPVAATPTAASQTLNVKANKGVILTTGGFQFNTEMLQDHAPWYLSGFGLGGPHLGDDGSGIKMGAAVGGDAFNLSFASPWDFVYAPGENCKGVLVDGIGRRFVAETRYGADIGDAVFRRNNGIAWLIMDTPIHDAAVAAGAVFADPVATADTLEELATALNLNVDVFANEIAFYNEHAAAGEDPVWEKHAEFLQPLETGPFIAFEFGAKKGIPFITLGGLRSNVECNVLNQWGETIPGLYSAGRTSPGISQEYYVSGSAVGDCTFWGKEAGRAASAAESW